MFVDNTKEQNAHDDNTIPEYEKSSRVFLVSVHLGFPSLHALCNTWNTNLHIVNVKITNH